MNPLAQSDISSRLKRSKGTENTPEPLSLRRIAGGEGGLEGAGVAIVVEGAAVEDNEDVVKAEEEGEDAVRRAPEWQQ